MRRMTGRSFNSKIMTFALGRSGESSTRSFTSSKNCVFQSAWKSRRKVSSLYASSFPQREAERPRDTTVSRQDPNSRPEKSQTENKLFCKRPLTESRPRPQTQVVLLPPNPVLTACGCARISACGHARNDRSSDHTCNGPAVRAAAFQQRVLVSDSLVNDRGCLNHRTEPKGFPCDINLKRRGPLNSSLNQRFGERVFHIFLQRPAQRPRSVAAVRARLLQNPLTCFR